MRVICRVRMLRSIYMHRNMSLRCTVNVVTTEDALYVTTLDIVCHALVQVQSYITGNVSCNGISTYCTLTATVCIVSNRATSKIYRSTLLYLTHLATAIDTTTDGATFHFHISPYTGCILCRIIFVGRSIVCSINTCKQRIISSKRSITRTTAGTIYTATDTTTVYRYLIIRLRAMCLMFSPWIRICGVFEFIK